MLAFLSTVFVNFIWRIRHTDEMRSILEVALNSYIKRKDIIKIL